VQERTATYLAEHGEHCQIRSNAIRNSSLDMPDWVSIVRKVEALILKVNLSPSNELLDCASCRSVIRYGHRCLGTIVVFSDERDVISPSHDLKSHESQCLDDILDRDICRELVYQTATPVSATKTSIAEETSSKTCGPKVSI